MSRVPGYEIDVACSLVRTRMWDELTDEDLRALDDRLQVDPEFVPSCRAICDLRSVTSITASVESLRFLAQRSLYLPEVFRSIADADGWLGLREQSGDPDRLQDAKK